MLVIVKYTRLVYSSNKNLYITLKIIILKNDIFFERVFKIIYFRALDLVLDQYKHYQSSNKHQIYVNTNSVMGSTLMPDYV